MNTVGFLDLTGQRFGRWTVTERGPNHGQYVRWQCVCDCGNSRLVQTRNLAGGRSQSCGCLNREITSANAKHRLVGTPEYVAWIGMKSRCHNPNTNGYDNYGGRGIVVCERWKCSFKDFLADVGSRPSKSHSLDRYPNQDGNYEPGNVRWATRDEQNRNMRNTRMLTFNGETLCMKDWARRLGVDYGTFKYRVDNWTLERAMSA